MRNAGLEEAQAGIKIARRNINNLIQFSHIAGRFFTREARATREARIATVSLQKWSDHKNPWLYKKKDVL